MDNNVKQKQIITLDDGKILKMNGVTFIEAFDSEYILLDTSSGRITVEGFEMKIESLSDHDGNIVIRGNVNGIFRSIDKPSKRGFFGKLIGK